MILDILEFRIEHKKIEGKLFWKSGLSFVGKKSLYVNKSAFRKKFKSWKQLKT